MGSTHGDQNRSRTLALAAEGDSDAWRDLVEVYSPRVYGLLVRQCANRELAEEITQDTFVKVVKQFGQGGRYKEQGKFEPWLFRIAMNRLRDEMRRRKRQATPRDFRPDTLEVDDRSANRIGAAPSDQAPGPFEQVSLAEQVERLHRAIDRLNEADREILRLRHTAGLSFPQIAATLEQPLGTVLSRGHRALAKLKDIMTEESAYPS